MKYRGAFLLFLLTSCAATRTGDLIDRAVAGDETALKILEKRGEKVLPDLIAARKRPDNPGGYAPILDLIFRIKKARHREADALHLFWKLEKVIITLQVHDKNALELLGDVQKYGAVDIHVDPNVIRPLAQEEITLLVDGRPFRDVFDQFCMRFGLDYDYRYGVLWIAPVERLWLRPAPRHSKIDRERLRRARALVSMFSHADLESRLTAQDELMTMPGVAIQALTEGARSGHAEVEARCRMLLRDLKAPATPYPLKLPKTGRWLKQRLFSQAQWDIATKLHHTRLNVRLDKVSYRDALKYFERTVGVSLSCEDVSMPARVSVHASRLRARHLLEILTLPYGLDAAIVDKVVIVYDPRQE